MANETSEIVVVCAPDGKDWAVFIQHKLCSEQYNIRTCTEDYTKVKIPSLSDFKVKVVLLSPQLLEGTLTNVEWDFSLFDKSSTVMILLGLGVMDIKTHLGPKSEYVFQCPHETINEDDPGKSLSNALVEIIKVYERDESFDDDPFEDDIYQYPPRPVQINRIDRIIPPSEDSPSKETLILLDRPADGDLTVKLQTGSPEKLTAEFLNKAVYSVKIPDGVEGTVPVKVSCKENVIGEDSIKVQSKLNQLHSLLQDITNPMSLMCQAMGLDSDSNDALDNALANQIKKQWSPQSKQIFQLLDTNSTEEKSSHEWPTLPHFVAEFNLVKTCAELLKFPSTFMVMACCMENCNGEYPCNIAEKKGYHDLAELLIQVVKEHTLDSGVVTDLPPPTPHFTAMHYVNQKVEGILDTESPYMDMSGLIKVVPGEMSGDDKPIPCPRKNPKGYSRMQRSVSDGDKVRISFMNPEYSASSNGEDSQTESGTTKVRPPLRPVSEGSADELSSSPESVTNFRTSTRNPPPPLLPQKKRPFTPPKPKPTPKPDTSPSSSYGPTSSSPETIARPQTLPRTLTSSPAPKTSDVQRHSSGETPPREQVTSSDQSLASQQDEFARSQLTDPEGAELGSPEGVDSEDTRHVKNLFGNILARSRSDSEPARGYSDYSDDFSQMTEDEEVNARLEAEENPSSLIGDAFNPSLRGKTTRSRISSFLRRLGVKKQISDPGDASRHDKSKKKTVIYGRQGRGSDPGLSGMSLSNFSRAMGKGVSHPRKMSLPAVLEPPDGRDSGSYSEEEEGSTDAEKIIYNRKKTSKLSASGNKKSLERKKSVRLSRAMNEQISDAPSMPQLSQSRSRFHSSSSAT